MPDAEVFEFEHPILPDPELAEALLETVAYYKQHISFTSEHHFTVVALWAAHTWLSGSFYATPRLILDSAEPGSGKSRVLELMNHLAFNAKFSNNNSSAALMHAINQTDGTPPTLLIDETDLLFARSMGENAGIVSALNSGYKKGATTLRVGPQTEDGGRSLLEYKTFCPVALAGIAGNMPAPLRTRGIIIHMRKRRKSDHIEDWYEKDAPAQTSVIKAKFKRWAARTAEPMSYYHPQKVDGVRDRDKEIWDTLLAVAEWAGDDWAVWARRAAHWFVVEQRSNEPASVGVKLLRDIKTVFGKRLKMSSADLIEALLSLEDSEGEWTDYNRTGGPINARQLAKELGKYHVSTRRMRIGDQVLRGYEVGGMDGLADAWDRYL